MADVSAERSPNLSTKEDVASAATVLIEEASFGGRGEIPAGDSITWADKRPLVVQLGSFPATSLLIISFIVIWVFMWRRRMSPAVLGSSYNQVVNRCEIWRTVSAAFTHANLLHLGFNIMSLWTCRQIEAELGFYAYLAASMHILLLAEAVEMLFYHALYRTGHLMIRDQVSCGYSGVIFAWMVVLSLRPGAPSRSLGGITVGGFTYVMMNLVVTKLLVRRSSTIGHLAGVWMGLVYVTGALGFARERYWGTGIGAWIVIVLLGSLKTTTRIPVPFLDYLDVSGRDDLGISVTQLDWGNREGFDEFALANT